MHVLGQLESASDRAARAPRRLRAALWSEPLATRTLVALEAAVAQFPELVRGQRKAYTMWSRSFAFAAARPWRGAVRLGLALDPSADTHLAGAQREGWSERLKSTLVLADARAVNRRVRRLLRAAWQRS
jgi:hypothetical protein